MNKKHYLWITMFSLIILLIIQISVFNVPVLGQSTTQNAKSTSRLKAVKVSQIDTDSSEKLDQSLIANKMEKTSSIEFTCEPREVEVYKYSGGIVSYCKKRNFPITENDVARVEIKPGAARTPHWHDTWEQQILISGKAKTFLIDPNGKLFEQNLESGNLVFIPSGWTHWSETVGTDAATFVFLFPANFKTFEVLDSVVSVNGSLMESVLGYKLPQGKPNHDLLIMVNKK